MTRELLEQIDWNDEDVALRVESIKQSAQKYGIKISKNKMRAIQNVPASHKSWCIIGV